MSAHMEEEDAIPEPVRREAGDVWVGVGSVLESGARARVKFFFFYSSPEVMHYTIQKKSSLPKIGCARGPQVRLFFQKTSVFGFFKQWPQEGKPLLVLVLSSPPLV